MNVVLHTRIQKILEKIETNIFTRGIRDGMVMAIPILLIGSISLLVQTLLLTLQQGGAHFWGLTVLIYLVTSLYNVTFGAISLYMSAFITMNIMKEYKQKIAYPQGATIAAVLGFLILSGGLGKHFELTSIGVKGMFVAIVSSFIAAPLYKFLSGIVVVKKQYTKGADYRFNQALRSSVPILIIMILFTLLNYHLDRLFGLANLQDLFVHITNHIFNNMGANLGSGILYVIISSVLWLFGMHGSDIMENVSDQILVPAMNENMAAVAQGLPAQHIISKTFVDTFVLIGGCGSLMCVFLAIVFFGKSSRNKSLAKTVAFPLIFNINEIMVFGLPIIFNIFFVIPFLLTPVLFTLTSYFAMASGLVPLATKEVVWTTPMLINGYMATGSIAGSLLQLFNLCLGVCIYLPFLKLYEKSQNLETKQRLSDLIHLLQESEESNTDIILTEVPDERGNIAKILASDIKNAMDKKELKMFYQPQFNEHLEYIGVEALLRWNHPLCGNIYPPLIIKLADETGILMELEKYVFKESLRDAKQLQELMGKPFKVSVNSSAKTIQHPEFVKFLGGLVKHGYAQNNSVCIEITEQVALCVDDKLVEQLNKIRKMGYMLAIDDFAMGNTSVKYLQSNQFDILKLDGSLVKRFSTDATSKEIIESIVHLSNKLGFDVLAEYVETEEMRQGLEAMGVHEYQGYLVSPAVPYAKLLQQMNIEQDNKERKTAV